MIMGYRIEDVSQEEYDFLHGQRAALLEKIVKELNPQYKPIKPDHQLPKRFVDFGYIHRDKAIVLKIKSNTGGNYFILPSGLTPVEDVIAERLYIHLEDALETHRKTKR